MLTYAANNVATQIADLENMITNGCNVLVIASIDGGSLGTVLKDAKEKGIMVVAYDRLLMDTPDVDYYATFDNYKVGVIQASYIIEKFDLDNTDKTFRMEVFAGSPDDNNARFFYAGAMDLLTPYIEAGKLVVTHSYVNKALGDNVNSIDPKVLNCGQCHIEYYFTPEDSETMMPYHSTEEMTPEAILAYYDKMGFYDWIQPSTSQRCSRPSIPSTRPSWARAASTPGFSPAPTATWAP